ncbi:phosphonate metabolism protein/1,5-bisphosphokinase (PRPP-forming) PhnN [Stappia sp.]|uniref:phosphonate metabolism protein/1,5-bisphosphokinase (PRPP-forming) PhnN n=1 Tax=Stappia sp. TaxID=1870903 RepID=UPI0032D9867D
MPSATPGCLIAVVGPSGVGKDTLMSAARDRLAGRGDLFFVRRTITRPQASDAEVHIPVTDAAFDRARADGAFCFWWEAHGLKYGLPASLVGDLAAGRHAVVNGSRKVLADMAHRFPRLAIVSLTARPEVVARRLAARGRESAEEIARRLSRTVEIPAVAPMRTVDNSDDLGTAIADLVAAIESFAQTPARSA